MEKLSNVFEVNPLVIDVDVNFDKSWKELCLAGRYDSIRFFVDVLESYDCEKQSSGKQHARLRLVRLLQDIETLTELIGQIEAYGFKPAGIHHLFTLGAMHPNLQRRFAIVSLEYGVDNWGDQYWPILCGNDNDRSVGSYGWTSYDDVYPSYGPNDNLFYLVVQP